MKRTVLRATKTIIFSIVVATLVVSSANVNTYAKDKKATKTETAKDNKEKSSNNNTKKSEKNEINKKDTNTSTNTTPKANYKKGTYDVALDGTGDFTSIATAAVMVPSGSTLIIHEGVYNEALDIQSKVVNMRGVSKERCVLQFDTSNYSRVPLNIAGGTFENLTINGYHKLKQTAPFAGYAIHIDCDTLAGQAVTFSNCNIISENAFCVGIGLRRGARITFRGCNFTAKKQGAILFHDSQTAALAGSASLTLDGCVINNTAPGLIITQCLSPASMTNLTLRNNTVIGNGDGYCLAYGSAGMGQGWMGASNVVLTKNSVGNNIKSFNYGESGDVSIMLAAQAAMVQSSIPTQKSKSGRYYTIRTEDGIETNIPVENLDEFSYESYGIKPVTQSTTVEAPSAAIPSANPGNESAAAGQFHTIRTEDGIEINVPGLPGL